MANENTKKEDIAKAIEAMVDEHLGKEPAPAVKAETTEKAMPASIPENGGEDRIRSGSPYSEKKDAKEDDKKVKKSEEELKAEADAVEKAKKEKEKNEKDDDEDEDDKKAMKAYKSLGELEDEEIELIKAWREEKQREAEEITKAQTAPALSEETLTKAVTDAITKAVEPLKKALEEKDTKIGELEKNFKKLASQPAYDKRSISSLEAIEKAESEPVISKAQVLDKMLKLQMEGKGVRSNHIAEFESTQNISDPGIKKLVMEQFK